MTGEKRLTPKGCNKAKGERKKLTGDAESRMDADQEIKFRVVAGKDLTPEEREGVIALCNLAYDEDMGSIIDQFVDPVHVLGFYQGILVCHALWITRYLQQEGSRPLRTAYVEAVATHPKYRCRGFASAIMKRVIEEIQGFDIAGLAPFSVGYYARLGWELWRGTMYERKDTGLVASPPDEHVMVYRLSKTPDLDLDAPISVEWREGEVW